jgi:hypothetical protein
MSSKKTGRTYSKINSGYLGGWVNSNGYFHLCCSVFSKLSIIIHRTVIKKKTPSKLLSTTKSSGVRDLGQDTRTQLLQGGHTIGVIMVLLDVSPAALHLLAGH